MTPSTTKVKRPQAHDIVSTRRTTQSKGTLDTLFWHRNWLSVATSSGSPGTFRRRTRGGALSTPRQVSTQRRRGNTIELHSDDQLTGERRIMQCLSCDRIQSIDLGVGICVDCYESEVFGE